MRAKKEEGKKSQKKAPKIFFDEKFCISSAEHTQKEMDTNHKKLWKIIEKRSHITLGTKPLKSKKGETKCPKEKCVSLKEIDFPFFKMQGMEKKFLL